MSARRGLLFWALIALGSVIVGLVGSAINVALFALRDLVSEGVRSHKLSALLFPLLGVLSSYLLVDTFSKTRMVGSGTGIILANYHTGGDFTVRDSITTSLAGFSTIGLTGMVGAEAPSMLLGAGLLQRIAGVLRGVPREVRGRLLLAGAAAGLASILKTPVTSILYSLEVPYVREIEKEPILESALAVIIAYFVSVTLTGPEPLIYSPETLGFKPTWELIIHGLVIGVVCGLYSLAFSKSYSAAGSLSSILRAEGGYSLAVLVAGAILGLSGLAMVENLEVGVGGLSNLEGLTWMGLAPGLLLLGINTLGPIIALNFGGVGGLFTPLAINGALIGLIYSRILGLQPAPLFMLIGMAATLSGCFKMLLSPVVFVAEVNGFGAMIPAILAIGVSYTLALPQPVFRFQLPVSLREEELLLERVYARLRRSSVLDNIRARDLMRKEVVRLSPTSSVSDAFKLMVDNDLRLLPIVDQNGNLIGQLALEDIAWLRGRQLEAPVSTATIRRPLTAREEESLRSILERMLSTGVHHVYIIDDEGRLTGVISTIDIMRALLPYLR